MLFPSSSHELRATGFGYQRLVISPPVVEPANTVVPGGFFWQPCRLSLQLDHLHVTGNRNEPWFLAEALVGLDIGSILEPAVQDVVARGRVGLMTEKRGCVLSESPKPNVEPGHERGPHSCKESSRNAPVRHTQMMQCPTKAQGECAQYKRVGNRPG